MAPQKYLCVCVFGTSFDSVKKRSHFTEGKTSEKSLHPLMLGRGSLLAVRRMVSNWETRLLRNRGLNDRAAGAARMPGARAWNAKRGDCPSNLPFKGSLCLLQGTSHWLAQGPSCRATEGLQMQRAEIVWLKHQEGKVLEPKQWKTALSRQPIRTRTRATNSALPFFPGHAAYLVRGR